MHLRTNLQTTWQEYDLLILSPVCTISVRLRERGRSEVSRSLMAVELQRLRIYAQPEHHKNVEAPS